MFTSDASFSLVFCTHRLYRTNYIHPFVPRRPLHKRNHHHPHHPNIWHLFKCFRKEEVAVRQKMLKMIIGAKKKTNKKAAIFQQRIDALKSDLNQNKLVLGDFPEGLSLLLGTK